MTPQERVVEYAKSQVGYVANADKTNKYAAKLDTLGIYNGPKNGFDWCDIFADSCYIECFGADLALRMTNQQLHGGGAGCWISAAWYRDAGLWSTSPSHGAQIFFGSYGDEGHTGIVTGYGNGSVWTVEGNTGYSQGYSGGAVLSRCYDIDSDNIVGYGVPNWSLVSGGSWVKGQGDNAGRWWYRHNDGTYVKNGREEIGDHSYFFDSEGWMLTGWVKWGGKWFYCCDEKGSCEGQMLTDEFIKRNGEWYYLTENGAMRETDIKTEKKHNGSFGRLLV